MPKIAGCSLNREYVMLLPVVSDAGSKPRTLCAVVVKLATVEMGLAVAKFRHVHPKIKFQRYNC